MNWQRLGEEQADEIIQVEMVTTFPFTGVERVIDDDDDVIDEDDEEIREIEVMHLDHERRLKVKPLFGNDYDRLEEQNRKLEKKLTPPLENDEDFK